MGQGPSGLPGAGPGRGQGGQQGKDDKKPKKKFEPRPPTRTGRKKRKKGPSAAVRTPQGSICTAAAAVWALCANLLDLLLLLLVCYESYKRLADTLPATWSVPAVFPTAKCRLRVLKLERIKDFLLLEEEYIKNQEVFKPREEKDQEERAKVGFWQC